MSGIIRHMFDTLPIVIAEPPATAAATDPVTAPAVVVDPEQAARQAREWADCSGAILAKLVADAMPGVPDLPDDLAGDQQIFDLITANARVAAWAAANQARLTALVHERARAEHEAFGLTQPDGAGTAAGAAHGFDDDRFTSSEIAANLSMELGLSLPVAEREVTFGLGLAREEKVRLALAVGRMDVAQARAVVEELSHLADPEVREPVVAAVVTDPQTPGAAACWSKSSAPAANGSGTCHRPSCGRSSGVRPGAGTPSWPRPGSRPPAPDDTYGSSPAATGWPTCSYTAPPRCWPRPTNTST